MKSKQCQKEEIIESSLFLNSQTENQVLIPVIINRQQMGTGGCLGPSKNKDQIYIQLITQMHEEATKISTFENMEVYQAIKQKLAKKGYLRKFIDNLSSHRNRVLQSLNLNYKLTTQGRQTGRHFVGLIIGDAIMEMIYPQTEHPKFANRNSKTAQEDCLLESSASSQGGSYTKNANDSRNNEREGRTGNKYEFYQEGKNSYDEQYFRLVSYLFDNEKKISEKLLESLTMFCYKHPGIFLCETEVWKTLQRMANNIVKQILLERSCEVYLLLLLRTRDQTNQQLRNHSTLVLMIKNWLYWQQKVGEDGTETKYNCFQIISVYFRRCISAWQSLFLYEVIFDVYDQIDFNTIKLHLLQKMYENVLKGVDLREHFLKGLFNYLLGYLSVTAGEHVEEVDKKWFSLSLGLSYEKMRAQYKNVLKDSTKVECFKLLNRWIHKNYININQFCMYNNKAFIFVYIANAKQYYRSKTHHDAIVDEYFKIVARLEPASRILLLQRIFENFREEDLHAIEYQLLLGMIKQMIYRNMGAQNQQKSHMLLSANSHKSSLSTNSKQLNSPINMLPATTSASKRPLSLPPLEEGVQGECLQLFLAPLSAKYSHEVKLQYLRLMGYVLAKKTKQGWSDQSKDRLCQFLYSIYDNLITEPKLANKYQLVCTVVSVIRVLVTNSRKLPRPISKTPKSTSDATHDEPINYECLLHAYVGRMEQELQEMKKQGYGLTVESEYMVVYFVCEIEKIMAGFKQEDLEGRRLGIAVTTYNSGMVSRKQAVQQAQSTHLPGIETLKSKMQEINTKITPMPSISNSLDAQLTNFLQLYHQLYPNGHFSHQPSPALLPQYKAYHSTLHRLFLCAHDTPTKAATQSQPRGRMTNRDSDVTSVWGSEVLRDTGSWRNVDHSFQQIIDIVHV